VAAFFVVGSAPLLAYVVAPLAGVAIFPVAVVFSVIALLGAGLVRAAFVGKTTWRSAIEMLAVGALAGGAAYLVGRVAASFAR
jgi:VIT1/CCC1 family predicted Fe2+/Mn2+ transporter